MKSPASPVTWKKGTSYKEMVSSCLGHLAARGLTHAEIGRLFDGAPSARESARAAARAALATAAAAAGVPLVPPGAPAPRSAIRARIGKCLKGNVITMHLNPIDPVAPLPFDRLPDLARAVGLAPLQCVKIFRQRTVNHPDSPSALSTRTHDWHLENSIASHLEIGKAKSKGGPRAH